VIIENQGLPLLVRPLPDLGLAALPFKVEPVSPETSIPKDIGTMYALSGA
jgi:hypothetical protein